MALISSAGCKCSSKLWLISWAVWLQLVVGDTPVTALAFHAGLRYLVIQVPVLIRPESLPGWFLSLD